MKNLCETQKNRINKLFIFAKGCSNIDRWSVTAASNCFYLSFLLDNFPQNIYTSSEKMHTQKFVFIFQKQTLQYLPKNIVNEAILSMDTADTDTADYKIWQTYTIVRGIVCDDKKERKRFYRHLPNQYCVFYYFYCIKML